MNRVTKIIATCLGIFIGLSGIDHAIFEIQQGNTPTNRWCNKEIKET